MVDDHQAFAVPVKKEPLGYDERDDPLLLSNEQLPYIDWRGSLGCSSCWDLQCYHQEFDVFPGFESDVALSSPTLEPSFLGDEATWCCQTTWDIVTQQDIRGTLALPFPAKTEVFSEFDEEQFLLLPDNGRRTHAIEEEEDEMKLAPKRAIKSSLEEKQTSVGDSIRTTLTWEIVSQHFYRPIAEAAKELNTGVTQLKKRCRELGIRRWPHRKLMSLQALIQNVKEMGGDEEDDKLKQALDILEKEKRSLEVAPDLQLDEKTKRLRQVYFKANYKKKKLNCGSYHRSPVAI